MGRALSKMEADYAYYEANRSEWFGEHPNEYVVIHSGTVLGFYEDYATAFKTALQKLGSTSHFLVQQVSAEKKVFVIY